MKITEIKQVIELMVECKVKVPLGLIGHRGIGKSQTVKDIARERNIPVSILRLGSKQDIGDLLGLPSIEEKEGVKTTKYGVPAWLLDLQPDKDVPARLLFIDEITVCRQLLLDAVMQILDEQRLDIYRLPENTVIICATNPDTEEYNVRSMSAALIDRAVWVAVVNEKESAVSYLIKNGFHPLLVDLVTYSEDVDYGKLDFELPKKDFTLRGIRQLNEMMPIIEKVPESVGLELVQGCVGVKGVAAFKNLKDLKTIPKAEDYLSGKVSFEEIKKLETIKLYVFVTRLLQYLKDKPITAERKKAFTKVALLSEPLLMYLFRLAEELSVIDKLIDYFSEESNEVARRIEEIARKVKVERG